MVKTDICRELPDLQRRKAEKATEIAAEKATETGNFCRFWGQLAGDHWRLPGQRPCPWRFSGDRQSPQAYLVRLVATPFSTFRHLLSLVTTKQARQASCLAV